MRRTAAIALTAGLVLAAPTATLTATLTAAPTASAASADGPAYGRAAKRPCQLGVVGFDANRHVRVYDVKDGRVVKDRLSPDALGFDVTAWGFYDNKGTKRRTLRLNAVTADGTPHNVEIKETPKKVSFQKSPKYDGRLKPRLFADGGTFFAYTVKGNTLTRYGLYRFNDGSRRFDQPVKVGRGFRDWTSLQAGSYREVKGVLSEILYGTTAQGELYEVIVPIKKPGRAKVRRLASTGYAGVTEIAWGSCGKDYDTHVLVTISPTTNSATWTTIKRPWEKPKTTLRGAVTGGPDWNFSAAF